MNSENTAQRGGTPQVLHQGASGKRKSAAPPRAGVPRLREALFADYPSIVALAQQYRFPLRDFEEWRHWWADNPALKRLHLRDSWPIGWVLVEKEGQIVGYIGNLPRLYEFMGREILAASGQAWIISPNYRSYATLLMDAYVHQNHAHLLIANPFVPQSASALGTLGALRVPVGVWDRKGIWIITYRRFVERWLRKKGLPAAKLFSYPIATALWARDKICAPDIDNRMAARSPGNVECCTSFDERFDRFWEAVRNSHPDRLLAVRSREMLQWHFQFAVAEKRLWVVVITNHSNIRAYSVFLLERPADDGIKRMVLVDFQSIGDNEADFYLTFRWALRFCRGQRIDLLESGGMCVAGITISLLAPYQVPLKSWSFMYKANDKTLAEALVDPRVWSPSLFDGDASL